MEVNHTKKPSSAKHSFLKIKKKFNRFYTPRQQKLHDLVIWISLTFGAFLPVRWFFYEHVTHHVVPNMGIVTLIAVIIFLLIRSGKIGFVGRAFNRQMIRFVASRTFKRVLIFSLALSLYTGVPLLFMERGEFEYGDELELFDANSIRSAYIRNIVMETTNPIVDDRRIYMSNTDFCNIRPGECIVDYDKINFEQYDNVILGNKIPSRETFNIVNNMTLMESYNMNVQLANNYDFLMSSAMHLANVESNGWTGHFSTVWFVEEIEAVGLYFLYRRWYLKKTDSPAWLGMYDKGLKAIIYKTEKDDKFYKGRSTRPEDKKPIKISISMVFVGISLILARLTTNEPILGAMGITLIGIALVYLVRNQRKQQTKVKIAVL